MAGYTEQRGEAPYAPEVPSKNLPAMGYKDMPEPLPLRKVARLLVTLVVFAVLLGLLE